MGRKLWGSDSSGLGRERAGPATWRPVKQILRREGGQWAVASGRDRKASFKDQWWLLCDFKQFLVWEIVIFCNIINFCDYVMQPWVALLWRIKKIRWTDRRQSWWRELISRRYDGNAMGPELQSRNLVCCSHMVPTVSNPQITMVWRTSFWLYDDVKVICIE